MNGARPNTVVLDDLSSIEARAMEIMAGDKWRDDQIDAMKFAETVTGRMSGGMQFNTIKKPLAWSMPAIDTDLLDTLRQPTRYEYRKRRVEALRRCVHYSTYGVQWRLMDNADPRLAEVYLNLAARYKTLYKFTQEELDGCSTQA